MATPIAFTLGADFDLQSVVGQLGLIFQRKGYQIRSYPLGAGACLELSRNKGGLNTVIGRCEGLKVNFMPGANMLNVSFSDEEWTDKVIALVIGWFTCAIPWIFAGIGCYNQYQLPKQVENELRMILGSVSVPQTAYYQSPAAGAPQSYQPYQTTGTYSYYRDAAPPAQAPQPVRPEKPAEAPPVVNPFEADPFGVNSPFTAPKAETPFPETPPPAPVPPVQEPLQHGKKLCPACGRNIDTDCAFCIYCGVKQE